MNLGIVKCLQYFRRRDRLNLQCPSARTFPSRLHSLGVAHQGFVSSSSSKKVPGQNNLLFHQNPGPTSQSFTPVPQFSSHYLRFDNGTQTQCPRTHPLLRSYNPILNHSSWFRSSSIKSFLQIKQQSESAANCARNMAELSGHDAAEDEADRCVHGIFGCGWRAAVLVLCYCWKLRTYSLMVEQRNTY
jgi:hypothetical protein